MTHTPRVDAVFIGPQSSGKSVYMTYLQLMEQLASHCEPALIEARSWSLKGVIGETIERPELTDEIDLGLRTRVGGEPEARPTLASCDSFPRPEPTKKALIYKTGISRAQSHMLGKRLSVSFADMPGEWAPLRKDQTKNCARFTPAIEGGATVAPGGITKVHGDLVSRMLARAEVVVLFVPFWSLLPEPHLNGVIANGKFMGEIWSTSIPVGVSGQAYDSALPPVDVSRSQRAVEEAGEDLECWLNEVLAEVATPRHWVVVLSQFQESAVRGLLSSFAPRMGARWWDAFDKLFARVRKEVGQHAYDLDWLAQQLHAINALSRSMIEDIAVSGRRVQAQADLTTITQLGRLDGRFQAWAHGRAEKGGLSPRVKSLTILPLNTVRVDERGDWHPDLRLCHDLLLLTILRTRAERIWTP